jgi:hypothetical protein
MIHRINNNSFGLTYGVIFSEEATDTNYWFEYAPDYLERIQSSGPMILGGEPGAGKSHIASDVVNAAHEEGSAFLMIACHINGGSLKGRNDTIESLKTAQDIGREAVVVFDNFDFAVYTGAVKRRKSNAKVAEYCRFITDSALTCADAGCSVLATVHTEEWRRNHSQAPTEVFDQFNKAVSELNGIIDFTGVLSVNNAINILLRRGIPIDEASEIANQLERNNGLLFRQAYHIDPDVIIRKGVIAAMSEVDKLKNQKIVGGA